VLDEVFHQRVLRGEVELKPCMIGTLAPQHLIQISIRRAVPPPKLLGFQASWRQTAWPRGTPGRKIMLHDLYQNAPTIRV
jgi:hypothetical protein